MTVVSDSSSSDSALLESPLSCSPVNEKKMLSKLEKHTLVDFPEVPPQ